MFSVEQIVGLLPCTVKVVNPSHFPVTQPTAHASMIRDLCVISVESIVIMSKSVEIYINLQIVLLSKKTLLQVSKRVFIEENTFFCSFYSIHISTPYHFNFWYCLKFIPKIKSPVLYFLTSHEVFFRIYPALPLQCKNSHA